MNKKRIDEENVASSISTIIYYCVLNVQAHIFVFRWPFFLPANDFLLSPRTKRTKKKKQIERERETETECLKCIECEEFDLSLCNSVLFLSILISFSLRSSFIIFHFSFFAGKKSLNGLAVNFDFQESFWSCRILL